MWFARASAVNYTIDDLGGDPRTGALPLYSNGWNEGQNCPGCGVQPDPKQAFDGTWHDATNDPANNPSSQPTSVKINFVGSAIYVFCIVPNTIVSTVPGWTITTLANLTFILDETEVGNYVHNPGPSNEYLYNVNVHSSEGLAPGAHNLEIDVQNGSYVAFDYAIYTFVDNTHLNDTSSPGTITPAAGPRSQSTAGSPSSPGTGAAQRTSITSTQPMSNSVSTTVYSTKLSTPSDPGDDTHKPKIIPTLTGIAVSLVAFCGLLVGFFVIRRRRRARQAATKTSHPAPHTGVPGSNDSVPRSRTGRARRARQRETRNAENTALETASPSSRTHKHPLTPITTMPRRQGQDRRVSSISPALAEDRRYGDRGEHEDQREVSRSPRRGEHSAGRRGHTREARPRVDEWLRVNRELEFEDLPGGPPPSYERAVAETSHNAEFRVSVIRQHT